MHADQALVPLAIDGSLNPSLRMVWPRAWIPASAEFAWSPVKLPRMVPHLLVAACAAALRSLGTDRLVPAPGPKPFCAASEAPTYPNAPKSVAPVSVSPT